MRGTTPWRFYSRQVHALLALLFLAKSHGASATFHFSLESSPVRNRDPVRLRIDSDFGCYPATTFLVSRVEAIITVQSTINDAGPCLAEWLTPRTVELGVYPAGTYSVRVVVCANAPVDPCTVWTTLPLVVAERQGIATIPAISGWTALVMGVVLALAARRRRRV